MGYTDDYLKTSRYAVIRWLGLDQFIPETAVTSHWVSPETFLAIRAINTLYSTIVVWSSIGWHATAGTMAAAFTYFIMLTFIGLHAYLVTALYHHVRYFLSCNSPRSFFNQPNVLNYLFYYLYHSILVFNIITPVIHWALLVDVSEEMMESNLRSWINISVHGISCVMMMTEMILCRIKMQINMVILILVNVILYMFLTFVNYASRHVWVYPILRWDRGPATVGIYIGIGAAFVVVFFIQVFFHYVRDRIATKKEENLEDL